MNRMLNKGSQRPFFGQFRAGLRCLTRWWCILTLVGLASAIGGAVLVRNGPRQKSHDIVMASQDDDLHESPTGNPGYLGAQACAACHAERVAEFQATNHFRTGRMPQPDAMPPGFATGQGTFTTRHPDLRFEMTQENGGFFQTAIQKKSTGEEERTSERIDLVFGAGAADEVYHYWRDDRLFQLPIAWLHPLSRWGNSPGFQDGVARFTRETSPRCLECHNTWFEHVAGTSNRYDRNGYILGVTCERCHGPGRDHVAFHEAHPEMAEAHAIVHPARLSRDRQLDACAQCHSNAIKYRAPAFSFRPGESLDSYFRTDVGNLPEEAHTANQVQALRRSRCFQESKTLTCTTCHDPHRRKGPANSDLVQRSCLGCHQSDDCAERPRLPAAVCGDCLSCHMPKRRAINVFFNDASDDFVPLIWRREHRIAVHPTARQEVLLAWHRRQTDADSQDETARLTKALVEYWLGEAEKYRREYRFLAAIGAYREAYSLDPAPRIRDMLEETKAILVKLKADMESALRLIGEQQYMDATDTLQKVLSVKPDLAIAHGKLGLLFAQAGKSELAVTHLQAVAKFDPDDPYGERLLGWLAYLRGDAEVAVEAYRRADEIEPFDAEINYQRGLALMKLDRWTEAIECFRRVLTIDPNHAGGSQGLGHALRQQGELAESLQFARRAAHLTDFKNSDVLLTLADTYADTGRFAEANATAVQALAVAETNNLQLVPTIRSRLQQYRLRAKHAAN